jgi:nicotinate-nucleotide--dimethylbenzimidazole phosphoribosyltransferase
VNGIVPVAPGIAALDEAAMAACSARLDRLTKPPGSLGRLEPLAVRLAGITGHAVPSADHPSVLVFAGDHGVARHGVSAYPSEVTAQMVANFAAGGGAVSVLARIAGATLVVVDVGVAAPIPELFDGPRAARLVRARIANGTRDLASERAMTAAETGAAMDAGRAAVRDEIARGADLVAVGEMGIGNTTSASALVAALTGAPVAAVTGRGTGIGDERLAKKIAIVEAALERHRPDPSEPLDVLACVGGLEIAALVGAILACAEARIPVVLDGFITGAAALVAVAIEPVAAARLIASHRSPEPGHRVALDRLGLEPLLELDLRLGEASGAALALPIVRAAAAVVAEMATFESAGVSGPAGTPSRPP